MINIRKINNNCDINLLDKIGKDEKQKMLESKIKAAEKASHGVISNFLNNIMGDFFNSLVNPNEDEENNENSASLFGDDNINNKQLLEHLSLEFGNILAGSREMKQLLNIITTNILSGDARLNFKQQVAKEAYYGK